MSRPDIEFLVTDKFKTIPTGARILTGLSATPYGEEPNYNSGYTNSDIFGQALEIPTGATLYFDVEDDSLSFTGTSNAVTAFTMGARTEQYSLIFSGGSRNQLYNRSGK